MHIKVLFRFPSVIITEILCFPDTPHPKLNEKLNLLLYHQSILYTFCGVFANIWMSFKNTIKRYNINGLNKKYYFLPS
jgi:hypothetical protein